MQKAIIILVSVLVALSCRTMDLPQTDRTRGLVHELLTKLDSANVYAARKEGEILALKQHLPGENATEGFDLCYVISMTFSNLVADSALVYMEKAAGYALASGKDTLVWESQIYMASLLAEYGYFMEARETIAKLPREKLSGNLLAEYYRACSQLYRFLRSDFNLPASFRKPYRSKFNAYRDSLMMVADTTSQTYLYNIERREASAGNYDKAREYNDLRMSLIADKHSAAYATCLYDRFAISYLYECKLTGEAVDWLLESAILEVENSNRDIASLLRVESLLISANEVRAAKKVSDYYFSSIQKLGSKKRIVDGISQTIKINEKNTLLIQKKNRQLWTAIALISFLLVIIVNALLNIYRSRLKIISLKNNLERSDKISKSYIGVAFGLYSSYIRRLDMFRTRINSSLRKGHMEQAMELTNPSGEIASEERRELFNNFDRAFVDIFPNFIDVVNSCLKPDQQIVPKRTEILSNELRILALIKLGIGDNTEIAGMLHSSVKTVQNLRSILKSRLAVPEEDFWRIISGI